MKKRSKVLVIHPVRFIEEGRGQTEEFSLAVSETSVVLVEKLKPAVKEFAEQMGSILVSIRDPGGYSLDEVELTLQVTAEGKIGLLGSTVGGSSVGGIKMKFKKRPDNGSDLRQQKS
jgi:hypothetical protein